MKVFFYYELLLTPVVQLFANLFLILLFFHILGDNILAPQPGFPLYQVIADSLGASIKHYSLIVIPYPCYLVDLICLINIDFFFLFFFFFHLIYLV